MEIGTCFAVQTTSSEIKEKIYSVHVYYEETLLLSFVWALIMTLISYYELLLHSLRNRNSFLFYSNTKNLWEKFTFLLKCRLGSSFFNLTFK